MQIRRARVTAGFWAERQALAADKTLWEQLAILKGERDDLSGEQHSTAIENFAIAAGELDRPFKGTLCNDSEVGKWLEAAAYSLMRRRDDVLEAEADALIALILRAQMDDGYLNTYFQALYPSERLKHFGFQCELYNMGHLMEAACAYARATGKRDFLSGMRRLADLLCERIGPGPEQAHVYDGHAEIELGLLALYAETNERRYLDLAVYFVAERGKQPSFLLTEKPLDAADPSIDDPWFGLDHHQAHMPVARQKEADGHAVKLTYLFSAVTELALLGAGGEFCNAIDSVWENMTKRRMYVTGAIGSHGYAERFSVDDDLPPDHAYAETCAAIGVAMWGKRMLLLRHEAAIADVMETALYNGMLVGWSLDGSRYFYANTLHWKRSVMRWRQDQRYIASARSPWFSCACCPPNILRTILNIESYLFSAQGDTLYLDGYASAEIEFEHAGANGRLIVETDYPYAGDVRITYVADGEARFRLALRKPGWCEGFLAALNGSEAAGEDERGYFVLDRRWRPGDQLRISMPMPPRYLVADPAKWEADGRAALARGPLVYCVEDIDQPNGIAGLHYHPDPEADVHMERIEGLDVPCLTVSGLKRLPMYAPYAPYAPEYEPCEIRAIPYFAWGNRTQSDMDVWLPLG